MYHIIDDLLVAVDLAERRRAAARVYLLQNSAGTAAPHPALRVLAGHALIRAGRWVEGCRRDGTAPARAVAAGSEMSPLVR